MKVVKRVKFNNYVDIDGKLTLTHSGGQFDGTYIIIRHLHIPMSNIAYFELAPELTVITNEEKKDEPRVTSDTSRAGKKKTKAD